MTSDPSTRAGIFTPELLDRCISCGFCLPACPTYAMDAVETSSPRGRINLMRALETGRLDEADPILAEEASFCLGCRACEPVCPAGVQYGELLEEWRDHQWKGRRRPLKLWPMLWAVNRTWRVRLLGIRRHARRRKPTGGASTASVNLMLGCFERVLYPGVSRDACAVDERLTVPAKQGCCGALHAHNGELERGRELARQLGEQLPGTIVTTSGGCAAHLASVLGRERVVEYSEWLARAEAPEPAARAPARRLRIAIQDSCHARNGLGIAAEPRALIERVGELVDLPSAGVCCGAAGSYSVLRPKDSARVMERHLDELDGAEVDLMVVINPGCYRQVESAIKRRGLPVRVLHIAELAREHGLTAPG